MNKIMKQGVEYLIKCGVFGEEWKWDESSRGQLTDENFLTPDDRKRLLKELSLDPRKVEKAKDLELMRNYVRSRIPE